jgi:hypothetical protein
VSGVAPLYVFFDASGTTSGRTEHPFHECLYAWDFGDPNSGQHGYGTFGGSEQANRNLSYGPLAGHVFDAPGRYTITCTVHDGTSTESRSINVTVSDGAAHEWAGERTMLVSTTGNFACAGLTQAEHVTKHLFTDWLTFNAALAALAAKPRAAGNMHGAGPVRVLFRSGETFTVDGGGNRHYIRSPSGPTYLGSYNDAGPCRGADARLAGVRGNAGHGVLQLGYSGALNMAGLIIQDLTIDCSELTAPNSGYGIVPKSNCDWALYRRITFRGCNGVCIGYNVTNASNLRHQGYHMYDGMAVVDCVQTEPSPGSGKPNSFLYAASSRSYIAGNLAYAGGELGPSSHNLRAQWFDKLVIESNDCRHPGRTQHCLKMHSDEVHCWGANTADGSGAFAPSSTLNNGRGEYRRPWHPVQRKMVRVGEQVPVFECTTGCAVAPIMITTGTPCVVNDPGHGFVNGQPVRFATTGALPQGISAGGVYFVRNATADTYELASVLDGLALSATGASSGRHTRTCLTWHSEPAWNTKIGATTQDGASVVWTCRDHTTIAPQQTTWRPSGEGYASTQAVVRANRFVGGTAPWPVALGAQDDDDFSRNVDITLFQNWWDCGDVRRTNTQAALQIWSERVSVYNNVFDLTNSGAPRFIVAGVRPDAPSSTFPAQDVWIYNNEFRVAATASGASVEGVFIDPYASRVIVINNLLHAPCLPPQGLRVVNDSLARPGQCLATHNLVVTERDIVRASDGRLDIRQWQANAIHARQPGRAVPVWQDFIGQPRAGRYDVGAFAK